MDVAKSGPGVFYQVMPGVTGDGKKVMKLIPGVMVNGKFVQAIHGLQTGVAPQKRLPLDGSPAQTAKRIVLDPPFTQQVINKVSLLNSTSCPVAMKVNNVQNKPLTQHKFILVNKPFGPLETAVPAVPMVQSPPRGQNVQLQNQKYFILKQPSASAAAVPPVKEKTQLLSQLPVTAKSVSCPRRIPPGTEVRTVSVSGLQPITKKDLPTHSGSISDPGSSLSSVISVTPITTAKQKATPPSPKEPIQPSYKYFPGPGLQGATKQLKLVQKTPQGQNGPCKWVIEEVDAAVPEEPSPVTTEARSALAGRTKLVKQGSVCPESNTDSRPPRRMSGGGDAVVVHNGKVFVVANKSNDSSVTHNLSKPLLEPREQDSSCRTPDRITEVIDLCEDDDNGLSPSSKDDDNVIFVSYMPPKPGDPDVQGAEQSCKQGGCAAGSDLTVPRRSPDRIGDNDLCGSAKVLESRSPEALKPFQQEVVEKEVAVEEAVEEVVGEMVLDEEVMERVVAEEMEVKKSTAEDMVSVEEEHTIVGTKTSAAVVSSSSPPPSSPTPGHSRGPDHRLRQMFDITADVRILLQRVDDPSARLYLSPLKLCNLSGSLFRGEAQHKRSASTTAHSSCLHGRKKSLNCSLLPHWPSGTNEVAGTASFVEPIEDDFLSDYENQDHDGAWQPTNITSRGGRTRKRPRCPCCIPGSGGPAAKARWSEAEPAAARRSSKTNRQKTDKKRLD